MLASRKKDLAAKIVAIAATLVFSAVTAPAQDSVQEESLQLEPMVVTAEKRSEDVQDIPASITAFSETRIEDARITTIQDFSQMVPNMFISNWGFRGNSFVFVRGIGAVNNDPAVGFYVDDVNYMDARVFDANLFDIERIEVLRGPQGTLYGRNSLAGVVNIVTRKPDNVFRVGLDQTFGNYDLLRTNVSMRTPLVDDTLFLGVAGGLETRDGYSRNDYLGRDVDDRDSLNGRMHLRWTPTDELDVTYSLDGERLRDGVFPLATLDDVRRNPHHVAYDYEGRNHRDHVGTSLRVAYDAPWFRLTSISAYRHFDDVADNDQDFTIYPLFTAHQEIDDGQFSQELRFASLDDGSDFKWLTGLYGFSAKKKHKLTMSFAPNVMLPDMALDRKTRSDLTTRGAAIFGQGTYTLFDRLDLTAGLRYDYEKSSMDHVMTMESNGMNLGGASLDESKHSDVWLPKFQLSYRWTPDFMTYAGISRGYRSGGFNTGHLEPGDASFDPEYSWNYEVGVKSAWLDNRLTLNAAAFYIDLRDQQVVQLLPSADTIIRNAGKSRSMGFEVESLALLSQGLSLEAGLGVTSAEYVTYEDPLAGMDYAKKTTPLAPEYTYNLAMQYRRPILEEFSLFGHQSPLSVFVRAEVNGIGPFYWNDANTLKQDAYHLVNMSLGLETENFDLVLWARNIFDTKYELVAFEFPGSDPLGQAGDPLTFGVTLRARF